jgi:hypothetical protein
MVLALVAMLAIATPSRDDDYMVAPHPFKAAEPPSPAKPGHDSPQATPATGLFQCNGNIPIANEPDGLAIGNCNPGWAFMRTSSTYSPSSGLTFYGGYMDNADFNSCGWIEAQQSSYAVAGTSAHCTASGSVSHALSDFVYVSHTYGNLYMNAQPGSGVTDGTVVNNAVDCPEYANFRPFSTVPHEALLLRWAPANQYHLAWRYLAKYPAPWSGGSTYYYLVRDVTIPTNQGNWVFVPDYCFGGHAY